MQITGSSAVNSNYPQRYQAPGSSGTDTRRQTAALGGNAGQTLDPEQQSEVQKLKDRDREVRSHEQAHLAAAGGIATSGANYQYVTGPDGQRYATGGEVSIDTSSVPGDPEATLLKADTIRRAALAPAQPSGQDYSVASKAATMASRARSELLKASREPNDTGSLLHVTA